MKAADGWVDPLERLIKDHRDISEYLENLQQILGFLHDEEAWTKLKPIEDFFQRSMVDHFSFEETEVFPPVLLKSFTPQTMLLMAKLQKEHASMLQAFEEFRKIAAEKPSPVDKETQARIRAAGLDIIERLLSHASQEDRELFPILIYHRAAEQR